MEKRDLYDGEKMLTGETINKGDSIPTGKYYLTVVVFIQNQNKEFLLQKNKKYDMWSMTGGHPKSGESSLEGIVTEIDEEIGVQVNSEDVILFETIKTEDDFVDLYYLKKDIDIKDIVMQEEEVSEVKWATIDEIDMLIKDNLFLPPHIEFYKKLIAYLNNKN